MKRWIHGCCIFTSIHPGCLSASAVLLPPSRWPLCLRSSLQLSCSILLTIRAAFSVSVVAGRSGQILPYANHLRVLISVSLHD
uniref:Secreted protein n=1 Tax=Knipowitschia caucasica TaxID=637954 RepID=A0AAV2JTJ6_KNICA